LVILNYFILGYFRLCEVIVGYFWLLNAISPYVIIEYFRPKITTNKITISSYQ
jgi:hypothetical protein